MSKYAYVPYPYNILLVTAIKLKAIYFRTAAMLKEAVFWDVAPCRYCVIRRFGGTYRLHLQGRRDSESRCKQTNVGNKLSYMRAERKGQVYMGNQWSGKGGRVTTNMEAWFVL
jgi:hypothetical protein